MEIGGGCVPRLLQEGVLNRSWDWGDERTVVFKQDSLPERSDDWDFGAQCLEWRGTRGSWEWRWYTSFQAVGW